MLNVSAPFHCRLMAPAAEAMARALSAVTLAAPRVTLYANVAAAPVTDPEAIRHALERAHGGHWLPQELRARRETLRRGQVSVAQQIERLTEVYLAGVVGLDEYRRRRGDLEQRQQALAAQEQQLAAQTERQADIARLGLSLEEFSRRIRQGLDQATWEQRRQLIEWLVTRVIVTNGEVEIRYVIPTSPAAQTGGICHLRSDYRVGLE